MSERPPEYRALALHWDTKIKPLVQKCLDQELLRLFSAGITPEKKTKVAIKENC